MSKRQKQIAKVLEAATIGYCNTTLEIADETGLSIAKASSYISELIKDGVLRRVVGRTIPNSSRDDGRGPPYMVFEPASAVTSHNTQKAQP